MRRLLIAACTALISIGCSHSEPSPVASAAKPAQAPAAETERGADAGPDNQEKARKAGILGLFAERSPWQDAGAPDSWWKQAKPCGPGLKLKKELDEEDPTFFCVRKDGVRHGPHATWSLHTDEQTGSATYRAGKLNGVRVTYEGGVKVEETTYRGGKKHGPHLERYSSDGEVSTRGQFKDGKRDGEWILLPYRTRRYRDGIAHGTWTASGKFGNWSLELRNGVVTKAIVKRGGKRVPSSELAGETLCREFVPHAKANLGWGDESTFDPIYVSCRVQSKAKVRCFLAVANLDGARKCLKTK